MLKFLQGVSFGRGVIHFHKTGVDIPIDRSFLSQVWKVVSLNIVIRISKLWSFVVGDLPGKSIAFYPQRAGPWYNARLAAEMAGFKVIDDPSKADYQFAFSDETISSFSEASKSQLGAAAINIRAVDISKGHVGTVFRKIFGYDIRIDPTSFKGMAVAKSETNGTHDGRVISCPITASDIEEGYAYQRLVPTGQRDDQTEDLRLLYVMNKPTIVFHKVKDKQNRFGTTYLNVTLEAPDDVFSVEEIDKIIEYCDEIGLDFGALDILRSTEDGKIYIVDVNKTGMPVLSLSLITQYKAFQKISQQFRAGTQRLNRDGAKDNI